MTAIVLPDPIGFVLGGGESPGAAQVGIPGAPPSDVLRLELEFTTMLMFGAYEDRELVPASVSN